MNHETRDSSPITGKECLVNNQALMYALVGFYGAFNTRDLGAINAVQG